MAFRKFVETGRVAFIAEGRDEGKLCAIVNIIDSNRVLVDGPCTGVPRQEMSIKRLHLTNFSMKFPWTASTRVVRKTWTVDKIDDKWKASRWAQRVESRRKRANLTDFERFQLKEAKRTRNHLRRNVYLSLLLNAKKKGGLKPPKTKYGKIKKVAAKKGAPAKKK
ncbi:60S ribosomal protein L14 [Orchesella cincta]|uniref:Large ribosomal subunit protein eL14 n=1 Tax=Orchesella cincta TaxID=48709 RepID=A0A1D2MQB5_ORCCI|nr:60S ribosomal protein L14 [Orchesella cincta]